MTQGEDPFRSDRATIEAENQRLREEVSSLRGSRRSRRGRLLVAALVLGADVGLFDVLRGLINAPNDRSAFEGFFGVALLVLVNAAAAAWLFGMRKS